MNKKTIYLFYFSLILGFSLLVGRLFWITIVKGNHYYQLAEGNRIRIIKKSSPRGIIYDRKGRILARNTPIYKSCPADEPTNCQPIDRETALKLESENKQSMIKTNIGREYPYGSALAHIIGYLGEATEEEVIKNKLNPGSKKGRVGIEEKYDHILRGLDGGELIEVDTNHKTVKKIGEKKTVAGQNLYLNIDAQLQKVGLESMEEKIGAIVASDPKTGAILALISSPSYDPNIFENCQAPNQSTGCQAEIKKILNNPSQPLFNRAISGLYPPGSTFKIVTAVAALEEDKINGKTEIDDPGVITVGPYKYANWYFTQYGKKEESVNLVKAIQRSTDTFFYKVGELVGIDLLEKWSKKFGLGQASKIDIANEASGLIPNPKWKKELKNESWFLGNTYHFAIGQGDVLTTPLQINMLTASIANNGWLCQPTIAKNQVGKCNDLNLKSKTITLVQKGMEKACAPGGTGAPLFNFSPLVACKTGTAEYGSEDETHAWITLYAPIDNPKIAVTVLVEGGGEGSSTAGPIAKKILEEWFKK